MTAHSYINNLVYWLAVLLASSVITCATGDHTGFTEKQFQKIANEHGSAAELRIRQWQDLIHSGDRLNERQKLELVNDFFNGARFIDDIELWRQNDYWATPLEFLLEDAGDCEDFSIAKYFTLRAMGVDNAKLRITYVKALDLNQAHMVLAYYPDSSSTPVILDNLNKRIKPAHERNDLAPVYSFNADDLWLARSRNEQLIAGKSRQLGRWLKLNERMLRELL